MLRALAAREISLEDAKDITSIIETHRRPIKVMSLCFLSRHSSSRLS
jgi:hypothetical protein